MTKDSRIILIEANSITKFPVDFQMDYHAHIYCHNGSLSFLFKGKKFECVKGDFMFWFAESDVSDFVFSADFKASILWVKKQFLMDNIPDQSWGIDVQLYSRENPILELNKKNDKTQVLANFNLLNETFLDSKQLFYEEVLKLQMQIFLFRMWNIFSKNYQRRKRSVQSGTLYERFQHLVQLHCMQEREVRFYANKLNITAKYLNFICKQNSDVTASEWIQRITKERIIILLQNKNRNISEIADEMNFSSRSFFTRYVKKLLGVSPSDYRNRLG
ncbi:MAG TPA: helix-turn-helix domain-containing protein [Flavobacterium sp.]|nr:helix-turn-helix domain-containing protein [Flavobacterium sp.]